MRIDLLIVARAHPDDMPSTRYRVAAFLPFLESAGITYRMVLPPRRQRVQFYLWPVFYARLLLYGLRAQTILVQKEIHFLPLWRALKGLGRRIVYDFDDAIYVPGVRHVKSLGCRHPPAQLVGRMVALADHVTVANRNLQEFALRFNPRAEVLPMAVDLERFPARTRSPGLPVTIGWIGSPFTTAYLAALQPVLAEIVTRHGAGVRIRIVSSGHIPLGDLPLEHHPWRREEELAEIAGFDIGLVPLPADEFAAGKSSYKLLQFMAAGLPTVASPVGFNAEVIRHGENGFLATTGPEWRAALEALIRDPDLRRRVGEAARARAEATFALRGLADRWLAIMRPPPVA